MLKKLKSYMMPVALIIGGIFYKQFGLLSACTPYLIATMLLISYSNITLKDIRITKLHLSLLAIQIIGSMVILAILMPFSKIMAEGAMICILAPTATSAVVITGMLGGNMASLTTYSLLSNLIVTFIAPITFSITGEMKDVPFFESITTIFSRVFVLLLLPFVASLLIGRLLPKVQDKIRKMQFLSFILWNIALLIVTGKTIQFIINKGSSHFVEEIIMAMVSLAICLGQFLTGRYFGKKYNDTIAGGQGLGQKNTILAIWMAQSYLNPLSSIAPGAYILWQNIVNSYQIWKKQRVE